MSRRALPLLVLLGVPLGVIIWAVGIEFLLRIVAPNLYQDHNLFPFEIVMYWIFAALAPSGNGFPLPGVPAA